MIRTAGISAALHGVLTDNGQRAVGERIDVAKSTLGSWGTDIRSWPADKLPDGDFKGDTYEPAWHPAQLCLLQAILDAEAVASVGGQIGGRS